MLEECINSFVCKISQINEDRLVVMEKAILADKKNLLPMYQKDNILMSLERFGEALEVLYELKEYAPFESSVFALTGIIYKRRNMYCIVLLIDCLVGLFSYKI